MMNRNTEFSNRIRTLAGRLAGVALVGAIASGPCHAQIEIDIDPTTGPVNRADPEAVKAAESLVARPGAIMASTEFTAQGAEAPAPPEIKAVTDEEIRKAAKDGAELIRILGLVPTKREAQPESELDRELFEQEEKARELLGENPTVIYRVKLGDEVLPDPMLVPWIAGAERLRDRFEQAVNLIAANKLSEARSELLDISTQYPDTEWGIQAITLLRKLDNLQEGQLPVANTQQAAPEIIVDGPVKPTTILFDQRNPGQSRVMILQRSYREGETIRGHPGHVVKAIRATEIDVEVTRNNASAVVTLPVRPGAGK